MIAEDKLIAKIHNLPPGKIEEVVDFIDALIEDESSNQKSERYRLIAAYAAENAGTNSDLDHELENAGIENLLAIDEAPR